MLCSLHNKEEQTFSLFTANGARIVEQDDCILADYLQKLHKSDAHFGIGELSSDDLPFTSICVSIQVQVLAYSGCDLYL